MNHPTVASPWELRPDTVLAGRGSALFEATLVPHRSLSRAGFVLVLAALAAICLSAGAVFFLAGAWPVFGFLGLDVLLIYVALRTSYAHGQLTEEIRLTERQLGIRRSWPQGHVQEWVLEPYWARVDLEGPSEEPEALTLTSKGVAVRIGGFLSGPERAALASELQTALRAAKAG